MTSLLEKDASQTIQPSEETREKPESNSQIRSHVLVRKYAKLRGGCVNQVRSNTSPQGKLETVFVGHLRHLDYSHLSRACGI